MVVLVQYVLFPCHYRLFKEILEASANCNEICFGENGSWRPISDQGIHLLVCVVV